MPAIYMSDRSSIRQLGVLQLASAFGVCLGAQKQSLRFFFWFYRIRSAQVEVSKVARSLATLEPG